jgi:hypothetical protein
MAVFSVKCQMRSFLKTAGILLVFSIVIDGGYCLSVNDISDLPKNLPAVSPQVICTVVNVAPDDILNVRVRPDVGAPVVGRIPPYGMGISIRESGDQATPSTWVPIRYEDLAGWVSGRYLARQVGTIDEAVAVRAGQMMWALKQKDMETLSRLVHPDKGVRFSPYAFVRGEDIVAHADQVPELMRDKTVRHWGEFDGTGDPISLTFGGYFQRFIYDLDFVRPHQIGFNTVVGRGNTINNITEFYPDAIFIEYHFEVVDPKFDGLDWRSLRLVLEKYKGEWYLVGIVHDEWTI